MKAIILAAGCGSRLRPLTDDKPKCMVSYQGRRLIDYEIDALMQANIKDIAVVGGYKFEILKEYVAQTYPAITSIYHNENFASTNMVASLFCASEWLEKCIKDKEDLIISYGDIVYFAGTIQKLKRANKPLSIVIDKLWDTLWQQRFQNPLDDAETLKIVDNKIIEIGKKPKSYNDIEGQYIGLFKIAWDFLRPVMDFYKNMDRERLYDGKDYLNLYMTSFLQLLIDSFQNAYAVRIYGNWCEIDSQKDLSIGINGSATESLA